ncbi:hypothetical protein [Granulicella paludicola]|uniref:hypothetical protein n=1 Tax=Granulicella paludicola TaxID=474951 RepID=UPI0021E0CFEA|nr:hypothetical protein [Granulicella paludicola]
MAPLRFGLHEILHSNNLGEVASKLRPMGYFTRKTVTLLSLLLTFGLPHAQAQATARFDLVGPKIDVRVTRNGVTLPIAQVPTLKPGDKLWIHPDLPPTQSVKYLLIVTFLRGTTNPPPPEWFTRVETWDHHVRAEGVFITVPAEAQQALIFMAPETGGDFSTLRSAVQGRPGSFVRASQDLIEAGFEEARIEKYIADIRRVPPADPADLQKHSDLLARTLALKPNADCFKRPVDTQFSCLTQTGTQVVLDDGHGQTVINALSNGPGSDLIQQASYTQALGAGVYSAYVGAIVDVIRIMGSLHTAQFQYIPAISFPQAEQMNLRLNTPPSFHNPKSVLVIALPAVQAATPPPLRAADPNHVSCLIQPSVVLPTEGAPLVFSADFAHNLVLHLNTPPGAPTQPDIPLVPDAYFGGLVLQQTPEHHVLLPQPQPLASADTGPAAPVTRTPAPVATQPKPVLLTGTVMGRWGFDSFTGPTMPLQQLPGSGWHIVARGDANPDLIAGRNVQLLLASSGTSCVHTITARPNGVRANINIAFKPEPLTPPSDTPEATPAPEAQPLDQVLALTLPLDHNITPGDLNLDIQQFDQPKPDKLAARTFAEPANITGVELHAGDRSLQLMGSHLNEVSQLMLGDLVFSPTPDGLTSSDGKDTLRLALPATLPPPSIHDGDHLSAKLNLHDGRSITVPVTVGSPRPSLSLLSKTAAPTNSLIALPNPDDLPLSTSLTFTVKSQSNFPRNGQIEIETLDGTLRTVLTLAPSGGLLLQDPHTVVATLDPLRSFGPSAFGALHLRAVFPGDKAATSDWLPFVTLVRLPTLTQLQCPEAESQPCTLTGSNLFLVQAISTDPTFTVSTPVPDGYTGNALTVPHPAAYTVFLKLRDDPATVDSVIFPAPPSNRTHRAGRSTSEKEKSSGEGQQSEKQPASEGSSKKSAPATPTQTQKSPAASPGSPTNQPS